MPSRLPAVAASVLAAGFMLTAAGCSHLTPLGPDPAATLPQPHHLRSPFVLRVMRVPSSAPVGSCPAGYITLPGDGSPAGCYRTTGTSVTINSAAVSPVSSFQPPPPPGQQAAPVQYVFVITVSAADAPALTAVITTVTGPQPSPGGPQGPPSSGPATSALTISVAGRTWVLTGFGTQSAGRQLEVAMSSQNQALQLQHTLAAPS